MKIVIVEDEPDAREYLIRILRKHFVQCQVVAICDNVPDAVNAIREQLHIRGNGRQLIIMDLKG